jgi:hypothetical protein
MGHIDFKKCVVEGGQTHCHSKPRKGTLVLDDLYPENYLLAAFDTEHQTP